MRAVAVVILLALGFAGCNSILGISDHALASGAGEDGGASSGGGSGSSSGSSSGSGSGSSSGADAACACVFGTSTVGNCCVQ
jgi:hypothetical protein